MKIVLLALPLVVGCGGSSANDGRADAATDTSSLDTSGDQAPERDTASGSEVADGDDGGDGATACTPGDVSAYTPSWHPPNAPQSRCSNSDLDRLFASCYGPNSTQVACTSFRASNPLCWACVVTPDTDPTWGAIFESPQGDFANFSGCLALETGDEGATSCGAKAEAMHGCTTLACSGSNCPLQTAADINAFNACTVSARSSVCALYASAFLDCENTLLSGGGIGATAVQLCRFETYGDFMSHGHAIAAIFCGPRADAGPDSGPADASGN